jgi:hypothetical protein
MRRLRLAAVVVACCWQVMMCRSCAAAEEAPPAAPPFRFSGIVAGGVLQRGEPVAVWGEGAKPGAGVVVTLHAEPSAVVIDAEANSDGRWLLSLPAQPTGWGVALSALSDGVSTRTNVSFGVVVQCAGQSNSAQIPYPPHTHLHLHPVLLLLPPPPPPRAPPSLLA